MMCPGGGQISRPSGGTPRFHQKPWDKLGLRAQQLGPQAISLLHMSGNRVNASVTLLMVCQEAVRAVKATNVDSTKLWQTLRQDEGCLELDVFTSKTESPSLLG